MYTYFSFDEYPTFFLEEEEKIVEEEENSFPFHLFLFQRGAADKGKMKICVEVLTYNINYHIVRTYFYLYFSFFFSSKVRIL